MSASTTVDLYFIGKDADDAVKNSDPYFWERSAQEDAHESEKIFHVPVTVFSSRVKEIEKW